MILSIHLPCGASNHWYRMLKRSKRSVFETGCIHFAIKHWHKLCSFSIKWFLGLSCTMQCALSLIVKKYKIFFQGKKLGNCKANLLVGWKKNQFGVIMRLNLRLSVGSFFFGSRVIFFLFIFISSIQRGGVFCWFHFWFQE